MFILFVYITFDVTNALILCLFLFRPPLLVFLVKLVKMLMMLYFFDAFEILFIKLFYFSSSYNSFFISCCHYCICLDRVSCVFFKDESRDSWTMIITFNISHQEKIAICFWTHSYHLQISIITGNIFTTSTKTHNQ